MDSEQERFDLPVEGVPPQEPEPEPPPQEPAGIAWGLVLVLLGLALVVTFTLQNTDAVPVRFLWMEGRFSLAIVVLVTVALTALVTELADLVYRRRLKRRLAEREELRRLRRKV